MSTTMKTQIIEAPLSYAGAELRPHFILSKFKIQGSALVAFVGPCDVKTEELVDWEDRLASDSIQAREMLHFLGEFFGPTLREGVWIQRVLMSIASDVLRQTFSVSVVREGDDLWISDRKMSVSIVTSSAVSQLLHVGINIDPTGAPVKAVGLAEFRIDPRIFATEVLARFSKEFESVHEACTKVRPV
ncbi:MAG: DUF366 family protein [Bdellovibrionales bacterium]|nr:DUF366 family protein [Bdellovibrionales bacterium]